MLYAKHRVGHSASASYFTLGCTSTNVQERTNLLRLYLSCMRALLFLRHLLVPRELEAEMPPKMLVGRRDCLHKMLVGRRDCLHKMLVGRRDCLHKMLVGRRDCLHKMLVGRHGRRHKM